LGCEQACRGEAPDSRTRLHPDGDAVVYDNQMGASDADDPTTALGGGSIVIHKP